MLFLLPQVVSDYTCVGQRWNQSGGRIRRISAALLLCVLQSATLAEKHPEPAPFARYPLAALGERGVPTLFSLLSGRVDMTLDYVDAHRVLLTFGARKLLARDEQGDTHADHTLQAEIINVDTGAIEKTEMFILHDSAAYVWPLGDGKFLLRQGAQFSVFGPDLEARKVFYTEGTVRWVQTTPAANFAAVIVEHEKHTPEEHQRLHEEALLHGAPPAVEREEAFGFQIRPELAVIYHADVPAVGYISGSGDWFARPDTIQGDKYRLSVKGWPAKDEQSGDAAYMEVAVAHSSCTPTAQVLSTQRLLLHTCAGDERKEAAIALNGLPGKLTGSQLWAGRAPATPRATTEAAQNGNLLLEQTVTPWRAEDDGQPAKGAVAVRDSATGAVQTTLRLQPLYGFTRIADVSPDGGTLAVLNGGELQLYKLRGGGKR